MCQVKPSHSFLDLSHGTVLDEVILVVPDVETMISYLKGLKHIIAYWFPLASSIRSTLSSISSSISLTSFSCSHPPPTVSLETCILQPFCQPAQPWTLPRHAEILELIPHAFAFINALGIPSCHWSIILLKGQSPWMLDTYPSPQGSFNA